MLASVSIAFGLLGGGAFAQSSAPALTATSFTSDFSAMAQAEAAGVPGQGQDRRAAAGDATPRPLGIVRRTRLQKALRGGGAVAERVHHHQRAGLRGHAADPGAVGHHAGRQRAPDRPDLTPAAARRSRPTPRHRACRVARLRPAHARRRRAYYVSFDSVAVGKLIGEGLVAGIKALEGRQAEISCMRGAPTDNNATLFAQGYDGVLDPLLRRDKAYALAREPAGTGTPRSARTTFEEQLHGASEHQRGRDAQ